MSGKVYSDAASALGEARGWEEDVARGTQFLVDEAVVIEGRDPERAALMLIRATMLGAPTRANASSRTHCVRKRARA